MFAFLFDLENPMTKTPISDQRISDLQREAALMRGDKSEAGILLRLLGWQLLKSWQIERLTAWLARRLEAHR